MGERGKRGAVHDGNDRAIVVGGRGQFIDLVVCVLVGMAAGRVVAAVVLVMGVEILRVVQILRVHEVDGVIAAIGLVRREPTLPHARTALRHRQFVVNDADMRDRSVFGLRRTGEKGRVHESGLRRRDKKEQRGRRTAASNRRLVLRSDLIVVHGHQVFVEETLAWGATVSAPDAFLLPAPRESCSRSSTR